MNYALLDQHIQVCGECRRGLGDWEWGQDEAECLCQDGHKLAAEKE